MNAALTFLVLSGQPDPLWEDLCRFPPRQVALVNLRVAQEHYAYLDGMRALIGPGYRLAGELNLWLEEADFCCAFWRHLEYASDRSMGLWYRKDEVDAIKKLVGEDRFRRGWCAPVIPRHHCTRAE